MTRVAAFVRGWFAEPPATFELRQPGARWGMQRPREARHPLRVAEVIRETDSTRTFVLEAPGGGTPPFSYRAGQHLTLLVDVDGTTQRRCYSFSTSPQVAGRPAITVKRTANGVVSNYLHDRVRTGDTLLALEPTGDFALDTDPGAHRHRILVAGGIGITPLVSIAEAVLHGEPTSRISLFYGNRHEGEIAFRQRLAMLEEGFPSRFRVCHALDRAPAGWRGLRGPLDGQRLLQALAGERAERYFVCGPEPMMQSVCAALESAGVPRAHIRTERFAYAAADATRIPAHDAEIHFARSGRRVKARAGQTILQAGLEAGIDLPHSCTMGGCGACKLRRLDGRVIMNEPNCLSEGERDSGHLLSCCAYADTDVVIEGH